MKDDKRCDGVVDSSMEKAVGFVNKFNAPQFDFEDGIWQKQIDSSA